MKHEYLVDLSGVTKLLNPTEIAEYLKTKIKVGGRAGNLGKDVVVVATTSGVDIQSSLDQFSKRYIKYLMRRYLRHESLSESFRILSANPKTYRVTLRADVDLSDNDSDDDQ